MTIINDAIKDANALQEAAVQLAQNKLIARMTPRIRKMVEARILNEKDEDDEELILTDSEMGDDELEIGAPLDSDDLDDQDEMNSDTLVDDDLDLELPDHEEPDLDNFDGSSMGDSMGGYSSRPELTPPANFSASAPTTMRSQPSGQGQSITINASGDVNINGQKSSSSEFFEARYQANRTITKANQIVKVLRESRHSKATLAAGFKQMSKLSDDLVILSQNNIFNGDELLTRQLKESFTKIIKTKTELSKKMKSRNQRSRVNENHFTGRTSLREMDVLLRPGSEEEADVLRGLDLDSIDLEMGDYEDSGEEDMEMDSEMDSDEETADLDFEMELSDDEESDDESGDEEDEDLEEASYGSKSTSLEESIVRRVRQALRRKNIRESAADAASSFGGGKLGKEMFVDVDEETLLNVLADELGRVKSIGTAAPAMMEARRRAAARNARANAASSSSGYALQEARRQNYKLKTQLNEMNLFSSKLIFVNRLFEGRVVTAPQRRAIVEAMDNAKTLKEAQLLYKSLASSLGKKEGAVSDRKAALTESRTRVLGSSSRATSSAQTQRNDVEVDRWSVLAGLEKK